MTQEGNVVITSPKEIRSLALKALAGAWPKIIVCYLIVHAILNLIPGILSKFFPGLIYSYVLEYMGVQTPIQYSFFPFIVSTILGGPFDFSLCGINLNLIRERRVTISDTFIGFRHFIKTFLIRLLVWLIIIIGTAPFVIAPMAIARVLVLSSSSAALQGFGSAIMTFGVVAAMIAFIFLFLLFSMPFYILWDNPNESVIGAIKASAALMKKNVSKLFMLNLSYIGWAFLALVVYSFLSGLLTSPFGGATNPTAISRVLDFVAFIPMIAFTVYRAMGVSFFYELATGHLVKSGVKPRTETERAPINY